MIKASFKAYNSYVTDSLYQWDINQVLEISGLNLSIAPEVHFSNALMDKAIVRQAVRDVGKFTVNIPNSLLQSPLTIEAHVGIYERDTFKVIEKVLIPVNPKTRPMDYTIEDSDEEIYSFNALENKINNMSEEVINGIENLNKIGNISDLTTKDKTSIVNAINSVKDSILPNYMCIGMISNYCSDLNDLKTNGIYFGHSSLSVSNKPINIQYFSLLVMNYDNVRIQQVAFGTNDTGTPIIKIRTSYNSNGSKVWGDWKSVTIS